MLELMVEENMSPEEMADFAVAWANGDMKYNKNPVGIREFILSSEYMNAVDDRGEPLLFPKVLDELEAMNNGEYDEAVLTGGIGTAKSTIALYSQAYQLYRLSCFVNPHQEFGMDPSSEIVIAFQSITAKAAKEVDYGRFKEMIDKAPYFKQSFKYNPKITSELHFPRRIIVRPVSGNATATIGQNIIGGLVDEVNFMRKITESKQATDGAVYDQAVVLYNSIARRRKSRFMRGGRLPGLLCLVSSKQYPGQFTDRKVEEAQKELAKTGKTRIYVYDKRTWEIMPPDRFSGKWFNIFIGDESRRPRILAAGEKWTPADEKLILEVPEDHRTDFERDILMALRDIGGVSTLARHPYMTNVDAVARCFNPQRKSILVIKPGDSGRIRATPDDVELTVDKIKALRKYMEFPEEPRWIHIDIGLTKDALGMSCGYVKEVVTMKRGDGVLEPRFNIGIDFILRVVPPMNDEIQLWRVRKIIFSLRDQLGLNIKWVSLDSFQSRDTIQLMRQEGFKSNIFSMDKTPDNYDIFKEALYDHRVDAPVHDHCKHELLTLEYIPEKKKIDHVPGGSKDVADALCGVVAGLSTRRELYMRHGVPVSKIPVLTQPDDDVKSGNLS